MKLSDLARITRARIEDPSNDIEIRGAAGLDQAKPGQVTFLSNPRYKAQLETTRASAIFVKDGIEVRKDIMALRAADPYLAYARALRIFHPDRPFVPTIHQTAVLDPSARISKNVSIGAYVVIERNVEVGPGVRIFPSVTIYEGAKIGEGSVIHSGVSIREGSEIGKRVIVHNNSVIGSDGFGFAKDEEGHWLKIPQSGRVIIEDDVEIGACSAIDRASVGETRIGHGVKIDNLVQIGHSCTVGEDSLLCGQVGLAGSSRIGRRVILAGQVGIAGHLSVGDDAVLMAQSGTFRNVPAGKVLSGVVPAFDHRESLRCMAAFRRLPESERTLRELETRVGGIETALCNSGPGR
jgi:UDP-3-O-[3-hydroxymyristoyl] glucosamine N-acyltransferase